MGFRLGPQFYHNMELVKGATHGEGEMRAASANRYRNCRTQRQSLLFGCAVVLAHSLRAAHFSGSEERGPRKHLPNIAGVSNGPRGRTYMAADLQLASRLRAISPGSSATDLEAASVAPYRYTQQPVIKRPIGTPNNSP